MRELSQFDFDKIQALVVARMKSGNPASRLLDFAEPILNPSARHNDFRCGG
jgi:hypothetical protein